MTRPAAPLAARLRTPRAAAVAGILFSLLYGGALTLFRSAVPYDPADAGGWVRDPGHRATVAVGLHMIPFAGIAFLWLMGVVRDRLGDGEDRFFATVLTGSGLLFVAMTFTAAAVGGGVLTDPAIVAGQLPSAELWGLGRRVTYILLNVFALRVQAVFVVSTTTMGVRARVMPRWLAALGYAVALVLLVGVSLSAWLTLLFPAWVLVLSLHILCGVRGAADGDRPRRPDHVVRGPSSG